MLKSIALIMLIGMSAGWVCRKVKLPGLIGMLFTGIILGALIFQNGRSRFVYGRN